MDEDAVMPIAVVGVAGRYPGDASSPGKLWEVLTEGRSAYSEIPADRFNIDAFYHPQAERQGTINNRGAHFLKEAPDAFDAPFFSITPNEAKAMDPQQRMCLEVAYEALENGQSFGWENVRILADRKKQLAFPWKASLDQIPHATSDVSPTITLTLQARTRRTSPCTTPPVQAILSSRIVSRGSSICKDRVCRLIRHAHLRWLLCIWDAKACELVNPKL